MCSHVDEKGAPLRRGVIASLELTLVETLPVVCSDMTLEGTSMVTGVHASGVGTRKDGTRRLGSGARLLLREDICMSLTMSKKLQAVTT